MLEPGARTWRRSSRTAAFGSRLSRSTSWARCGSHGAIDRARRDRESADLTVRFQFCRYLGRPPIAQGRLELLADGRVRYRFKRAWKDGSTAVDLEPFDLLARLCALVPPPRFNMVRYHGVLSARAKLRAEVVPSPTEPDPDPLALQAELPRCVEPDEPPRRKRWAWLLRHVFRHDVSVCPRCQGPTTWLEVATEPDAIGRAMADHGLAPHRARPPPAPRRPHASQLALPL